MADPLVDYALRMGDSALILAHRVSEWCGHAPALEEDIALADTALDLIGQARKWLTLAGEVEGAGRGENDLACLREAREFRNLLLVERPDTDFAYALVRQMLFDLWHLHTLTLLEASAEPRIAEIAEKGAKEAACHLQRSADLTIRLGDGSAESHARMGPVASLAQRDEVRASVAELRAEAEIAAGDPDAVTLAAGDPEAGAYLAPMLLRCADPMRATAIHSAEAFGPVSTLMPYERVADAVELARKGGGNLVASVFTNDPGAARDLAAGLAPWRGRILIGTRDTAKSSTGHAPARAWRAGTRGRGRGTRGDALGQALHATHRHSGLAGDADRRVRGMGAGRAGAARCASVPQIARRTGGRRPCAERAARDRPR